MKEKISKKCIQYFVDGLNCHYNSDFKIKGSDNDFIIFNNDEKSFDFRKSLHLNFIQKNGEFTINLINYNEEKNSKLKNLYKSSQSLNPVKTTMNGVLKLMSITMSNDSFCSVIGMSSEALCNFIKYMNGMK
jgi:hypothetical protein